MSISPQRPVGYTPYAASYAPPALPLPPAPMPGYAPVAGVVAPTGPGAAAVARAAMTGQSLAGASPLQAKFLGLVRQGQAAMNRLADTIFPATAPKPPGVLAATPYTFTEKLQQVGRSALFFALPVGGAALVAFGLGSFVGPWVPIVGSKALGAGIATFCVGETAGSLLHGAMRLPLVTKPEDRELNSAGATIASAGLGAAFAAGVAALAGASVGAPVLLAGAAIGALPRLAEWALGKL